MVNDTNITFSFDKLLVALVFITIFTLLAINEQLNPE